MLLWAGAVVKATSRLNSVTLLMHSGAPLNLCADKKKSQIKRKTIND